MSRLDWLAAALGLAIAIGGPVVAACSAAPHPTPVPTPRTGCELDTPPLMERINADYVGESECPAPYVVCLDLEATNRLTAYLGAVRAWQADVMERCGK